MSSGSEGETPAADLTGGGAGNLWMSTLLVLVGLCVALMVVFFVMT